MINKTQIIREVSAVTGHSALQTKYFVEAFLNSIEDHLIDGDAINFAGFGIFRTVKAGNHMIRNPKTGERVMAPEYRKAKFKTSIVLNRKVRNKK